MTQRREIVTAPTQGASTRKPWIKPKVDKIKAGDAEVGTRTTSDGAFTTS